MAEIYRTATEFLANEITLRRGSITDITRVGVHHTANPNEVPTPEDFVTVQLVDGTIQPPDSLAEAGRIDILSLVGPKNGDVVLEPGSYQRWLLIVTATEDVIRRADTLTVL